MRKRHFLQLAQAVARVMDRWAEWSEPGTAGRTIGLDVAESIMLDGLAEFVEVNQGDGGRWMKAAREIRQGKRVQVRSNGR